VLFRVISEAVLVSFSNGLQIIILFAPQLVTVGIFASFLSQSAQSVLVLGEAEIELGRVISVPHIICDHVRVLFNHALKSAHCAELGQDLDQLGSVDDTIHGEPDSHCTRLRDIHRFGRVHADDLVRLVIVRPLFV